MFNKHLSDRRRILWPKLSAGNIEQNTWCVYVIYNVFSILLIEKDPFVVDSEVSFSVENMKYVFN